MLMVNSCGQCDSTVPAAAATFLVQPIITECNVWCCDDKIGWNLMRAVAALLTS